MKYRKRTRQIRSFFSYIVLAISVGVLPAQMIASAVALPSRPYITPSSRTPHIQSTQYKQVLEIVRNQLGITPAPAIQLQNPTSKTESEMATTVATKIDKLIRAYNKEQRARVEAEPAKKNRNKTPKTNALAQNSDHTLNKTQGLADFYRSKDRKPLWVSDDGILEKTRKVLVLFKHADNHGLRPRDFVVQKVEAKGAGLTPAQLADFELNMSRMVLKYAAYARGGRIDPRSLSRFQDRGPRLPAPNIVLEKIYKSDNPGKTLLAFHPQHPQFIALRKRLLAVLTKQQDVTPEKKDKNSAAKLRARLLINMERWRWMPEKMQGDNNIFVWANVPELRVRIIKDGTTIFAERVIAGKRGKQSPMFSDKMEWIEFNPTWFIPNSIKVADILPSLRRKGRVMSRYHLRLDCGKFGTDYSSIDWNKVDIRKCAITQPTGVKSVLGKLKFKFPNKHSVYMHDTLTPRLFNQKHRILSHGCIRVRNPRRMAEVLLAHDKGMAAGRIGSLLARGALHTEHLLRPIPVHITYFSTRVAKNGALTHYPDYYGHDKRLAQALFGKGHLFKGAVYGGRSRYKRKRKKKKPAKPEFRNYFSQQY